MEVLREFKTQLTLFLDELIDQFPEEGDLVVIRLFISNQVPIVDIMNNFNHSLNKNDQQVRNMIKERNEKYFIKSLLFNKNKSKLSHFKKLWRSGRLDGEDKETIWKWVDTFVFLADKYITSINMTT